MTNRGKRVAVVGVGYSEVGRRLEASDDELVRQAVTAAMADAGMMPSDIDGLGTMGGNAMHMAFLLGISPLGWFHTSAERGPAFVEPAVFAISAVASGLCNTAVAVRLIRQMPSAAQRAQGSGAMPERASGDDQFVLPFGGMAAAAPIAGIEMQRHMSQYGTTEEHFALHAVGQREHASRNEDAIFRDPITVDDYFASRYVSKPARVLDCDYPIDSASAVIFTTVDRAADCQNPPVMVESHALSAIGELDFWQLEDFARTAPVHCAELLWSRTDLTPDDVDCAQLYDGFSIITFQWLEALGFCGFGEAGPWIAEGNGRLDGRLPLNTDGGACNVGRRHGANYCIEAVRQLRGQAGPRQVADAEVAVWSNGVGPFAGAVLLTAS
jgi:acetyl-CoA acetyltransferase